MERVERTNELGGETVTSIPMLIIASGKHGRKRIWVERRRTDGTSLGLIHILRGYLRNVEVIDADGNCYSRVKCQVNGIDTATYFHFGTVSGILALFFELLFCTVLMRVAFSFEEPPTQMSLSEIKKKVCEGIKSNPNMYVYAPAKQIIGRVNASKDVPSLIANVARE